MPVTMKILHVDGREVTEEELIEWITRDHGLLFKIESPDVLIVHEALDPPQEIENE